MKNDHVSRCRHNIIEQTHLGHSDTLTPDMMGINKGMFIVHCDCNNRGGGIALIVNTNLHPKQIRMNTIFEIVVEISEPIQNHCDISLQATINTN